jgi:hypothetical protein
MRRLTARAFSDGRGYLLVGSDGGNVDLGPGHTQIGLGPGQV